MPITKTRAKRELTKLFVKAVDLLELSQSDELEIDLTCNQCGEAHHTITITANEKHKDFSSLARLQ